MQALICIDMQNDFCLPGANLCVAGAMGCLPRVIQAVEFARKKGIKVIWVIREHDANGEDVEHTRAHLYHPHGPGSTVAGTQGAKLVDGLSPLDSERVIVKKRFSAFFQTPLDMVLRRLGVKHIVLCGVQTPNCIRAAAYDGISLDYSVTVLSDATASKSDAVQAANLDDMACAGIGIATTQEWCERCA